LGTLYARQGDIRKERVSPNETRGLVIRREGAPPATSEDLGGHSEQFAASEFFNVEVVEEFFKVKVVELFVEAEQSVVSEFFNIEVESEFFNIEVVDKFFNIEAGQFGFVASELLPKRVGRAHLGSSRRGEAVRRGGGGVLQRQGGGGALLCRGGGGGVRLRRDQAAARMPRPSTFFKASRLKISVFVHIFE